MDKMKVFQVPTVYCSYCGHVPISEPCAERVHVTKQLIMRCANRRCLAFDALFKLPIVEQEVEVTGMHTEPDFKEFQLYGGAAGGGMTERQDAAKLFKGALE